ncbi:MAG: NAD-binding protein, partial [Lachnospiraceae bacterium]|nr:NAD-binding protein [Lachnospiraceae bacterium]
AYYLAEILAKSGISVKLIEKDRDRSRFLSLGLPKAQIINADATVHENLLEEGLPQMDAFVALTTQDETNIFLSLYADKVAPKCKKITKISKMAQDEIIEELPIGSIISARNTTTEYILKYVRSLTNSYGSNVEALYRLMDNQVEALEFHVKETGPVTGTPLFELQLKSNLLICCIVRGKQIITPSGRDTIELGDTVIVVTTNKGLQDISDILAE